MEQPQELGHSKVALFFGAAQSGNISRFQWLAKQLVEEADDDSFVTQAVQKIKDLNGLTAFHHAAMAGQMDFCQYILDKVESAIDTVNNQGKTSLMLAIQGKQEEIARFLVEKGADPNLASHQGHTALHASIIRGYDDLALLLIAKGADVNARCDDFGTPLLLAATFIREDIMKALLQNNADPNKIHAGICYEDVDPRTSRPVGKLDCLKSPLFECVANGSVRCMELLLQNKADPNFVSMGSTLLHHAVIRRVFSAEIVGCLIHYKANADAFDFTGKTPLELAAERKNKVAFDIIKPHSTIYKKTKSMFKIGRDNRKRDKERLKLFNSWKKMAEDKMNEGEHRQAVCLFVQCLFVDKSERAAIIKNGIGICVQLECARRRSNYRRSWLE